MPWGYSFLLTQNTPYTRVPHLREKFLTYSLIKSILLEKGEKRQIKHHPYF
jgi:hypothetical protein